MQARAVLLLSLTLNLILGGLIFWLSRDGEQLGPEAAYASQFDEDTNGTRVKTHVVVRRQPISWSEIESAEYPEYIANLRRIGCPEKTIRDIIVADVNELFNARIRREVVLPEQEWWKPDPDMNVLQSAADQIRALNDQKHQLITQLLGPGWDSVPAGRGEIVRLDGPVLSNLAPEVKEEVFRIVEDAQKRQEAYLAEAAAANQEPDPVKLAALRQEVRDHLGRVLTPEQLEEYLLRYSVNAENLRQQMRGFDAGPEEFRRIFRAMDAYERELARLEGDDPATAQRRQEIEQIRDTAVRQAIGEERFTHFQLTRNPLFLQAQQEAEQNGAPAEKVLPIFQVNQAAQEELRRIQADPSLSEEERRSALRLVQDQQENSIQRIIRGEAAPPPPLPE